LQNKGGLNTVMQNSKKDVVVKNIKLMNKDELNELSLCDYSIYSQENKKQRGKHTYTCHCEFKPGLGFDFYLEEAEFFNIVDEKAARPGYLTYNRLKGACQILKLRKKETDSLFYSFEVALLPDIFRSKVLSEAQVKLLLKRYSDIPVVDMTDAVTKDYVAFAGTPPIDAIG